MKIKTADDINKECDALVNYFQHQRRLSYPDMVAVVLTTAAKVAMVRSQDGKGTPEQCLKRLFELTEEILPDLTRQQ